MSAAFDTMSKPATGGLAYCACEILSKRLVEPRHVCAAIAVGLFLSGCGGSGGSAPRARPFGSLSDVDLEPDQVTERARAGTTVGLTIAAPELAARGAVTFSMPDASGGVFAIDAMTGVVTLVGGVDYETAATRTITARATTADNLLFAERSFTVTVTDSPPPIVDIEFPFAHANYAYAVAGVSGRVTHADPASVAITASAGSTVVVGTVESDGRFFVKDVPVSGAGTVTIDVFAVDLGNDIDSKSVTFGRAPEITAVSAVILDAARDRFLFADRYSGAIIAVARNGFGRSVLSGAGRGSGSALVEATDLALDPQNDRLYVLDVELDSVFRVDLVTGDRVTVSGPNVGSGTTFLTATALAYDPSRGRLLVTDDGRNTLVAVNPATGDRTVVSDNSGAFGTAINFWTDLDLDLSRNRAIILSGNSDELFSIDLTTGARALMPKVSDDPVDASRFFTGISLAAESGVGYLADDFSNAVVRVDLSSGARRSVTSSGLPGPFAHPVIGAGPLLEWPTDVFFDVVQSRLFVIEEGFADPFMEIDEASGTRTLLTDASVGSGINFKSPWGIRIDAAAQTAYVVDETADMVVAVDLRTGARCLIAGNATGRGTIDTAPLALALDEATNSLYVADFTLNSLYAVDIGTGAERVVSDQSRGTGAAFGNPYDVAVWSAASTVYVLDRQYDVLVAVDIASGNRRPVASGFLDLSGFALDIAQTRAYVADAGADAIVSVDLANGAQSVVSSLTRGTGPRIGALAGVALDAPRNRLLAIDTFPTRVLAIDLATGNRTAVSGAGSGAVVAGGGPDLEQPRTIDVDASRQIAYVTDNLYDAVIAVDLRSGYRQIVAR